MSRFFRTRDGAAIDMLGVAALALLLGTIIFAVVLITPVWSLYKSPPALSVAKRPTADAVAKFQDSIDHQMRLVDGRSWFFEPKPPDAKPGPTTIAKRYEGPALIAYINGTAYFADGQQVSAAEPKSKSLKYVRGNPPWTITVQWEGGEFPVELFKRTEILSLKDGSGFSSAYPAAPARTGLPTISGIAPSDRSDLPLEARRGPGADAPAPTGQTAGEPLSGRPSPPPSEPAPAGTPPATPTPNAPPAPGAAPSTPPSTPPPAPVDPRPEPAPQVEHTSPSKP